MHSLIGLRYIATGCAASPGWQHLVHSVRRRTFDDDGSSTISELASPTGSHGDALYTGDAAFIAEQGDSLIFRTNDTPEGGLITVVLTLSSDKVGELFATDGLEWVRSVVAIESLPEETHRH